MARPGDSLRHSLLILAAIGERLQTTHKLAGEDVRAEATHALVKLEALEDELLHQYNKNVTPTPPAFIVGDTPTWRGGTKAFTISIDDGIIRLVVVDGARIEFIGDTKLSDCTTPKFTTGHCEHHNQPGGCHLHNLHCGYPNCDRKPKEST